MSNSTNPTSEFVEMNKIAELMVMLMMMMMIQFMQVTIENKEWVFFYSFQITILRYLLDYNMKI